MAGAARECLPLRVASWCYRRGHEAHSGFLGERKQFGVALGTFQALAMRMADSYIDVEAIRSTYWLALWRLSEGLDARAEVRAAKWWACDAAHRVVCTAQHLHGGTGADIEYPIHRFYLMAKQISFSLGNASQQLEKLGRLLAEDDSILAFEQWKSEGA